MEVSDVSTSLSEAALGFCTKHVHVSSHLSIHGSITMVTDYETSIGFYSRDCHNVKDVKLEPQQSRTEELVKSSNSNCKTNKNKSALRIRQPVGQETKEGERSTSVADFPTITIATADNTPDDVVSSEFVESLSDFVVQYCEENLEYVGNLGIHGIITVVADHETAVTFYSKNLPERPVKKEQELDSSEVVKKGSTEKNSCLQGTGTEQSAVEVDRVDTAVKSSHDQELARLSRLPVKMEITETNNEASMSCSLIYEGSIDNENPMVNIEKKAPLIVPESNTSKIKQKGQDFGVKENRMTATEKKAPLFAPESNSSNLKQKEQDTGIKENLMTATEKKEPCVVPECNSSKLRQKEQDTGIKENLMTVDVKKEPCVTESKPCEDIKREVNIGSEENLRAITEKKLGPPMAPNRNPENKHTEINHEKPTLVNEQIYKSLITTEGNRCKNKGRKQGTGNTEKLLPMEKKKEIPPNVSMSNTYESKGIEHDTRVDLKNAISIGVLKRDSPAATEATYSENIQRVADIGHEESILNETEVIPELGEVTDSVDIQTTVYDSTTSIQRMLETGQNSGDKSTEISKPVCTTTTGKNSESSISSRIISAENVHGMLETGGNLDVTSAAIEDPEGNPTCTSMTQNNSNRPTPLAEKIQGNLETPHHSGLSTSEKDPVCTTLNQNNAELPAPRKSSSDNQTENILKTSETGFDFEPATIENDPACTTLGLDIAGFSSSADHIQRNEETGPDSDVDVSETDPACTEVTHDNASNTASRKSYLHNMERFNLKECSVILQKVTVFEKGLIGSPSNPKRRTTIRRNARPSMKKDGAPMSYGDKSDIDDAITSEHELVRGPDRHDSGQPTSQITPGTAAKSGLGKVHQNPETGEKTHKCTICTKLFHCNALLVIHYRKHTGERPYQCSYCKKRFIAKANCQQHEKTCAQNKGEKSHSKTTTKSPGKASEKRLQCSHCEKQFTTKWGYERHQRIHGEKPCKCSQCDRWFKEKWQRDGHEFTHLGEGPYKCKFCDKVFVLLHGLKKHIKSHAKERYKCKVCQKVFSLNDKYQAHLLIHPEESSEAQYNGDALSKNPSNLKQTLAQERELQARERPCKCNYCDKRFTCKGARQKHERIHTGGPRFKCQFCEKSFLQKGNCQIHERIHTGEKPFNCSKCEKTFRRKHHLDGHMDYHLDDRPYKCKYCDLKFKQAQRMLKHEKTHTIERPFSCSYCILKFTTKDKLMVHKKVHYGKKRPFKCSYCTRRFTDKKNCRKHENVHTGETPFPCRYCEKQFSGSGKRNLHEMIHTGKRPHKCNFCDKGFKRVKERRFHERVHTGKWPYQCSSCGADFKDRYNLIVHERTCKK